MTMLVRGGAVTGSALPATATTGQVLSWNGSAWVAATPSATGTTPNATTTVPGLVQLAGDLAGTATAPTVTKINGTAPATVATTGAYTDLTGRPVLAPIATSGAYTDLTGRPALAGVATSGAYTDLTGRPALAGVATSGSYGDLTNRPLLAPVATSGAYTDLTGRPTAPQIVAKPAATQRISTNTLALDPDLVIAGVQPGTYLFDVAGGASSSSTFGVLGAVGGTATFTVPYPGTMLNGGGFAAWPAGGSVQLANAATGSYGFSGRSVVVVTAAGSIGLSWAPATITANPNQVLANSALVLTKLA